MRGETDMQRLALFLAVALGVSGCTGFSYISKTYVSLSPQVVTIGCNDPYEVYDQRQQRRMLVVSNAVREFTGCGIGERHEGREPAASRTERFRLAARTYLDETVREDCKLAGETIFTDLQTEFRYTCDAPVEQRGAKVPRLPGRVRQGAGPR